MLRLLEERLIARSATRRQFDDVEPELKKDWHDPGMTWDRATQAVRDAWYRTGRAISSRK